MGRLASNRDYLRTLIAPLKNIPAEIAINTAQFVLNAVLEATRYDSGQAVWNWHVEPYNDRPSYAPQEILWGYGGHQPVNPVGWKWSGGQNEVRGKKQAFMDLTVSLVRLKSGTFHGITVYNPITPGHPNFAPLSDENYEEYALGEVKIRLGDILSSALRNAEIVVASQYHFLRAS